MNTIVTSREEILKASRILIQQNGWAAVNMRSVAAACGVSVGSVYNYFDSKTALVSAAVESVWNDIFHHPENGEAFQDTLSCIRWMYQQMEYGCQQYPGFFAHHSLVFIQHGMTGGKEKMHEAWQHILSSLCDVLKNDSHVSLPRKNLQAFCFLSCFPPWCARILTPAPCWKSCAEPSTKETLNKSSADERRIFCPPYCGLKNGKYIQYSLIFQPLSGKKIFRRQLLPIESELP